MFELKLIKGLSYAGYGVNVNKENPLIEVETKETVDLLLKTGRFDLIGETEPDSETAALVNGMNKEALIKFAEEKGIDIAACSNNDERKNIIIAALAASDGEIDYTK